MNSLIKCIVVITTFLFQTVVAEENTDIPIYHVDANNLKEVVGYADMGKVYFSNFALIAFAVYYYF